MESHSKTVLVIDDEKATLTMFRLFLQAYGYDVVIAEDGKSGLDLAREKKPAIVFTDLKMPEMDGFEVLKRIKKNAPGTEVIVITGHGDMDLVVQALNLEATDFINKPIKRAALDAALKRAEKRLRHPLPCSGRLDFQMENDVGVISVEGTLRRDNRQALLKMAERACDLKPAGILVRFAEHAAFDGAGIGELINGLSAIRKNGQTVAVAGLSENFKVISEMVGLTRFAVIYDTTEAAMKALKPEAPAL